MCEIVCGKCVLDVCCYIGGFALNAAFGGVLDVVVVDSFEFVFDMVKKNVELNGF